MFKGEIDDLLTKISSWINSNSAQAELDYQYSGFDAVEMRKILIDDYSEDDLNTIIIFCLMRGNRLKTNIRISPAGLDKIKKCFLTVVKENLGPKSITVSRICCCFPERCASFLMRKPEYVKCVDKTLSIPTYLCFPQGASLIPMKETNWFEDWKMWAAQFDELINAGKAKKSAEKFWNASLNCKIFNDEQRIAILNHLTKETGAITIKTKGNALDDANLDISEDDEEINEEDTSKEAKFVVDPIDEDISAKMWSYISNEKPFSNLELSNVVFVKPSNTKMSANGKLRFPDKDYRYLCKRDKFGNVKGFSVGGKKYLIACSGLGSYDVTFQMSKPKRKKNRSNANNKF